MKHFCLKYGALLIISLTFFLCIFTVNAFSSEIHWNNPFGGNWSNPANWSTGIVPGPEDDAVIDLPGLYTVTADVDIDVQRVTIGTDVTFFVQGRTIDTGIVNSGTCIFQSTNTINGSVQNLSNGLIRVHGVYGHSSQLNSADGFTNQGIIELTNNHSSYGASLRIISGILLNQGTIKSLAGVSGGPRNLYGELDNQGILIVDQDLRIGETGDFHTNTGTINIEAGKILTFYGNSLKHSGALTGPGTISLSNMTFNLDTDFTYTGSLPHLNINYGTINGPGRFINQDTLMLIGTTVNCDLVNESVLNLESTNNFNGSFENQSDAVVRVRGSSSYGHGTLITATGFTNSGTIELDCNSGSFTRNATLRVTNGVLENQGILKSLPGTGGSRYLYADLDNQGSLIINQNINIGQSGDIHTNTGTINVAAGKVLKYIGTSFTHSGALSGTGTIEFSGIIFNLTDDFVYQEGYPTLDIRNTTLNGPSNLTIQKPLDIYYSTVNGSGSLINKSTLNLFSCTVNYDLVNESVLNLESTNNFNGSFENQSDAVVRVRGSSSYGHGTLITATGFTNSGTIELDSNSSSSTRNATLRITNGVLENQGILKSLPGTGGSRYLYADLDNQSSLIINQNINIGQSGDIHTNTGTIDVAAGKVLKYIGTSFTQSGDLTGTGIIELSGITFNITENYVYQDGGPNLVIRNATLNGPSNLTIQKPLDIYYSTVNGSGSLINKSTFNLFSCTVNYDLVNESVLNLESTNNFNGSFENQSDAVVRVRGSSSYGHGTLITATGFTNSGTIELDSNSGSFTRNATLRITSGVLVNQGILKSLPGTGGSRYLYTDLDNQGSLIINQNINIGQSGDIHTNTGTINVAAEKTVRFYGSSITNNVGGIITGNGLLNTSNSTLINTGHISPGVNFGILNVTGSIDQNAGSNTNIDISGTAAGTEYDQIQVSGPVDLDGVLNVALDENFNPQLGDSFDIITAASRTGTFKTVNPFTINGALDWDVTYSAAGAQLTVVEGPGGLRLVMTDNPDPIHLFQELTYTLKVFNSTDQTAANVVVTDILPSTLVFASAQLSRGTFTENEGTVVCSLGNMVPMESATIKITVVPVFVSTIQNTATMTTDTADIEAKSAIISTTITPLPGDYDIDDSPIDLGITGITPDIYGNTDNAVITLSGIGFDNQTAISLIGPDGTEYFPESAEPDSLLQMTVMFDLSGLPVGRYDIKISDGTETRILNNAFEVFETQKADLETSLVLPASFGRHAVSTIYVDYKNTGNVSMPAPMLILQSADEDGSDKPLLTLDPSKVIQNLWTASMPEGVVHTVRFLADGDGDSPGILLPGESGRMPVYYTGLLQPWDFSDTSVELEIRIVDADDPTPYDWEDLKDDMKPGSMDTRAWDIIFANLVSGAGVTWGNYIAALSDNAIYLSRHFDQRVRDINELFRFELAQAMGLGHPLPYLAGETDMAIAAPGLPLVFSRSFSSSVAVRFKDGPLGPGWRHAWQTSLEQDEHGNVTITSGSSVRTYTLDSRGGYFSSPGDYARLSKSGDIFTLTYANGIIQRFTAEGRLDCLEDLNHNRITAIYNGNLLTQLTHSSGQFITFVYSGDKLSGISDHTGQLSVNFAYHAGTGQLSSVTDILGRTTQYAYGGSGVSANALIEITYPDGNRTGFDYDDNGRLAQTDLNDIPQAYFAYDTEGTVIAASHADSAEHKFYYDSKGHLGKYVDPLGHITSNTFDANHKLTQVRAPDGSSTKLSYDTKGNAKKMTDPLGQEIAMRYTDFNRLNILTDAKGNTTSFSYDMQGNPETMVVPDLTQENYFFDAHGNLDQKTDRKGSSIYFTHNADGFVLEKTSDDGTVSYTYNDVGSLTSMTDSTGTTTWTYYSSHLLQRITYPTGLFLEYTYDTLGRRTSMTDQDGRELTYTYTVFGQLESITETGIGQIVHYTYDAQHRLSSKTLGNGATTVYTYDIARRLERLVNYDPEGVVLSRFDYTFDEMGRRIGMASLDGTWSYSYDRAGRMVSAEFATSNPNIADQNIAYTYDKNGNRVQVNNNGSAAGYTINSMNQYTQTGNASFEYDADGNLIAKTDENSTTIYTYNSDSLLKSVSGPDGLTEYQYDGLGNLTAVTKNGTITHYLIDPSGYGNTVGEYDDTGTLISKYNHGMGLMSQNEHYFTFDGSGSAAALTDNAGISVNTYVYEPFGKVIHNTGTVENEFQFAGQFGIRQAGDDLYFMRNRFYMPETGRFINEDPIGLAGGINLYTYVFNDPLNFVDPTGQLGIPGSIMGTIMGGTSGFMAGMASGHGVAGLSSGIAGAMAGGMTGAVVGIIVPNASATIGGVVGGIVGGAVAGAANIRLSRGSGAAFADYANGVIFGGTVGGLTGGIGGKIVSASGMNGAAIETVASMITMPINLGLDIIINRLISPCE